MLVAANDLDVELEEPADALGPLDLRDLYRSIRKRRPYSLDFAGANALTSALQAWQDGIVIASHDRGFLEAIGIDTHVLLDGEGGHRVV